MMLAKRLEASQLAVYAKYAKDKVAEVKEDGDRAILTIKKKKATLTNRSGKDITYKYPEFHTDMEFESDCVLDGELVVLDKNGVSQFNEGIQFRSHCESEAKIQEAANLYPVTFIVFDILEHGENDMKHFFFKNRRWFMEKEIAGKDYRVKLVKQSKDIMGLWREMVDKGAEGIIIKNELHKYQMNKRSSDWLKVKNILDTDVTFDRFERHNKGIVVENSEGIRVNVNGAQAEEVAKCILDNGSVVGTINHLGDRTKSGKLRQPTWKKIVR
jgi:bifunctional non-homologous end joining protein LigD